MFYEEIRVKQGLFLYIILSIEDYNSKFILMETFGNKCCYCNEGSLYIEKITIFIYICPQLRRSWRGILLLGRLCVCASVRRCVRPLHFLVHSITSEPCMLGFEISCMDSS